jgi:Fic family protein
MTDRQRAIFWIIWESEPVGISAIATKLPRQVSIPTLNRDLAKLKETGFIQAHGRGPGTKYTIVKKALMSIQVDLQQYFKADPDNRKIVDKFNHELFAALRETVLFTDIELDTLHRLTEEHKAKLNTISEANYKREFERLMIELSWKSSQIEGNTYDLLDTELLLRYNIFAPGHSNEEAIMLLNHKKAIEYIRSNLSDYEQLSLGKIIDIHTLLVEGLGISKTLRTRLVRITGTKYAPPDNTFVIEEALNELCSMINAMPDTFNKALLALLLISYIQPFEDGNKRTARLTANAILMANKHCPLSYRSISPAEYHKSILLFYELNNFTAFKKLFISQYQFAVENYF